MERQRARAGAWYELFPRSWGGLAGVTRVVPELAELGFDVVYLPPIHPIGRTNRKGRNNAERAQPGDVGSPWAIGATEGGHDAIRCGTRRRFRSRRPGRRVARARHGARARPRVADVARPPLARRAPGVVPAPARRDAEVRREPAEALPGHPQPRLGDVRPKRALERDPRRRAPLVRRGGDGLPGRQPAYQARPVLGVADRGGSQAPSRDRVPLRGVHASLDDDAAREGRLLAVVHLLHLEEHEGRARRARRAAARMVTVPPPEPLAEHAGHPPRVPPAGRPARVRVPPRARGDALPELRDLFGLRGVRERPRAGGERGVPGLGEVRG